jgi:predicted GIY-YIG superfamily endonuclease
MRKPRQGCTAYVIRNPAGAVYVGTATVLHERLRRHNSGGGHPFTEEHPGPWTVVHYRVLRSRNAAMDLEAVWTNHLRATGTLPFINFAVTAYGPQQHGDHARRDIRRLTRKDKA